MGKIEIDRERCKGCLLCVGVCPKHVIVIDGKLNKRGVRPVKVDPQAECIACLCCALICPDCCIEVYK